MSVFTRATGLVAVALVVGGCSNSVDTSTSSGARSFTLQSQGVVMGGPTPVVGAAIQMYVTGAGGDGTAATPLGVQTPTDVSGAFTLSGTYQCPSMTSLVYVVAKGGNPGLGAGGTNPNLSLMVLLGQCGSLTMTTKITMNELTTVAATAALSPFMTSPSSVASSTTDGAYLINAFTVAAEYVNSATGLTPGTNVPTGVTIPVAELNTLANIAQACVNSAGGKAGDGSACGQLFTLTTPASGIAPTDVATAFSNLANNPGMNAAPLYALASPSGPFQPQLTSAPVDFGVRPQNSGASGSPTPTVTVSSASLSFVLADAPQNVTLSNYGTAPIAISNISFSGAGWTQTNTCGATLAGQSVCTISVQSTSSTIGTFTGSMTVVDSDTADAQTVALTTDNEVLAGTIDFGNWVVQNGLTDFNTVESTPWTAVLPQNPFTASTGALAEGNIADFNLWGFNLGVYTEGKTFTATANNNSSTTGVVFHDCAQASVACLLKGFFSPSTPGLRATLLKTSLGTTYLLKGTGIASGPHLVFHAKTLDFGTVPVGTPDPIGATILSDGSAAETISTAVLGGANPGDFADASNGCTSALAAATPATFTAATVQGSGNLYGGSESPTKEAMCSINLTFTPTTSGVRTATLTVTDASGLSQTLPLVGGQDYLTAPSVSPNTLSFGNVMVNQTATSSSFTVTAVPEAGTNYVDLRTTVPFTTQVTPTGVFTVAPSSSCSSTPLYGACYTVTFAPTAVGPAMATISFTSPGSAPTTLTVMGTGTNAQTQLSTNVLNFGTRADGTVSLPQMVTLTNTGNVQLNISQITSPGANFIYTTTCGSTVAVGGNCMFSISFSPQSPGLGTENTSISIYSNSISSPDSILLQGAATLQ